MKALFFHADTFGFAVESRSEKIGGCEPEIFADCDDTGEGSPRVLSKVLQVRECLVALFHVEDGDGQKEIARLCKDIRRIAEKVGTTHLVVAAFGHLSHRYASPEEAMEISGQVVATCRAWEGYEVFSSPFGHNKTFILHAKGHPDAVKHRSYGG